MDNFKNLTNVITQEAESVISTGNNKELEYKQIYNVRIPEPEEQIILKKSIVKKIKIECEKVRNYKFQWAEIFLSISSLFLGAFLGALASKIPYEFNFFSILYYNISPTLGIGFFIAYIFNRKKENEKIINFADKIQEYLLEIDDIKGGKKNEY